VNVPELWLAARPQRFGELNDPPETDFPSLATVAPEKVVAMPLPVPVKVPAKTPFVVLALIVKFVQAEKVLPFGWKISIFGSVAETVSPEIARSTSTNTG